MTRVSVALVVLFGGLLGGLGPGKNHAAHQPFTIQISAPSYSAVVGSGVEVEIIVRNTSATPLDCSVSVSELTGQISNLIVDVRDEHGHEVSKRKYPHPELAAGHAMLGSIPPGETWSVHESIDRLFDMSRPGKYIICVSRPISFADPKAGDVTSNSIEITLVLPHSPAASIR